MHSFTAKTFHVTRHQGQDPETPEHSSDVARSGLLNVDDETLTVKFC